MSDNNNININTPDIGPYTQLRPFRFWCQKVLPLVYDESLSYYELLCKVVDYLNKTMEDVDQMITDMGEFQTADRDFKTEIRDAYIEMGRKFDQLQIFVETYFDTLDVQTEINNKLDAMAASGYFNTLFTALFTDDVVDAAGNAASAWIAENILQETGYVIDKSLTVENAAADAKATGDAITSLANKTFTVQDEVVNLADIPGVTYANAYAQVATDRVQIQYNANYDTYYYITDKETALYCENIAADAYYTICKVENASGTWIEHTAYIEMTGTSGTGQRLRNADGNLPTQLSPLTVPANTLLAFSVAHNAGGSVVFKNVLSNTLNNNVRLNENQLAQINQKILVEYETGTGLDSSTEWVNIYIPSKDKYIKYVLAHTENESRNVDTWRIANAYLLNGNFVNLANITTTGEWEMAIKLQGADDFIGGYQHGDEVMIEDAIFFIDGFPVDITDYTDKTAVDSLEVVTRTNMFNPVDSVTLVGKHGCRHLFDKDGLLISQSVNWSVTYAIAVSYLAMLPISKAESEYFLTNYKNEVTEITGSHTEPKATYANIYGDNVSAFFEIPEYKPECEAFIMSDNGGNAYNKCYYKANITENVNNGTYWKSSTKYNIIAK